MSREQYPIPREHYISDQDIALAALAPGDLSLEQALERGEIFHKEFGAELRAIDSTKRDFVIGLGKGALVASAFLTMAANPAETKEFAENLDKISPEASKEIVNVAAGVIAGTLATIKELGESREVDNWGQIVGNAALGSIFGYFTMYLAQSIPDIKKDFRPYIAILAVVGPGAYVVYTTNLKGRVRSTKEQFTANRQQRDAEIEYRQLVKKAKSWRNRNERIDATRELQDRGYRQDKNTGEWV